jgi:hypothetical protein
MDQPPGRLWPPGRRVKTDKTLHDRSMGAAKLSL